MEDDAGTENVCSPDRGLRPAPLAVDDRLKNAKLPGQLIGWRVQHVMDILAGHPGQAVGNAADSELELIRAVRARHQLGHQ